MPDDNLRLEVWSLPHVGTFQRRMDISKQVESFTFNDRFNDLCDGVLAVPDDATIPGGTPLKDKLLKIDEANHANDVGSVIRLLRGTTPVHHQIVTRSEDSWSEGEPTTKFATEGLEWILDRALVPAYDRPNDPAVDADWIYGADSVLGTSGLEDTVKSVEVQHFYHTQTSGTYTITYSGQTTSALAFGASWFDVHQALEALSNIQDVVVTGAGTISAPFVIEFLDPAGDVAQITSSATGAIIGTVTVGGVPSVDGWTRSFHPQTGLVHGTYDQFEVSTAVVRTGTYSLLVDNGATTYPTDYGGAQQVVSVFGGRTYRAEIWVRPTFTGDFRLVIRTMDETIIEDLAGNVALAEATLTANVWTKLTIAPFRVPTHIDRVIFRIGNLSSADTGDWYVDDAVFAPGFPAATLGKMMSDIRTAAIAAGAPLSWLTPTWSTTLDSDGAAWDADRKWDVQHDQSIYQLIEYARDWNYESRIRWDVGDNRFEWDMWNPTAGGQTRANISITGRSGVEGSAPIVKRPPGATYMRVEGALGAWGEFASTTLDDVWGRLEKSHRDRQGVNSDELDILAQRLITTQGNHTASRVLTVSDPAILPWTAYEPGDTVDVNLAPKDTKRVLRVAAIVVAKGRGQAVPRYDVHFGSPVYSNEAAMAQGLRTLWRKVNRPAASIPAGKPQEMLVGEGSTPTVVIAASNSTPGSKGGAQFHCLGTDDHLVIQQALTWLAGQGGGRLVMCEGDYNLGGGLVITNHIWIEGMGRGNTVLKMQSSANATGIHISAGSTGSCRVTINHLTLDGTRGNNTTGHGIYSPQGSEVNLTLDDCDIYEWSQYGVFMERTSGITRINKCRVYNNDNYGVAVVGEGYHSVVDSLVNNNGWSGVYVTGASAIVSGCQIYSNTQDGINHEGNSTGPYQIIVGNEVYSNTGRGIYLANSAFGGLNVIEGNSVHDNSSHGIQVAGSDGHNLVADNVVWLNSGSGIYMGISGQTVIGGVISGNQVGYSGQHGIILDQVHRALIVGNHVTSNSKTTNITYDGIHVFNNSDNNFITANKVYDTAGGNGQRYGFNIAAATCDINVYVNNDCRGSGRTADYNDAGTGSINTFAGGAGPGDNF